MGTDSVHIISGMKYHNKCWDGFEGVKGKASQEGSLAGGPGEFGEMTCGKYVQAKGTAHAKALRMG